MVHMRSILQCHMKNVYVKPNYLTWEEAAAIPLGGLTAYRALFTRGGLKPDETVLIPGIGSGVALFLLQLAVTAGADVFVTSSSDEKIERAKNWEQLEALIIDLKTRLKIYGS